jgi:hypothetical protein
MRQGWKTIFFSQDFLEQQEKQQWWKCEEPGVTSNTKVANLCFLSHLGGEVFTRGSFHFAHMHAVAESTPVVLY